MRSNSLKWYPVFIFAIVFLTLLISCSTQQKISKSVKKEILDMPAFQTAHVGISIYDPATNKYLFEYQGDKYFVPASNTKIPTCYAAMKYLDDSLKGLEYLETDSILFIRSTADPSLLHRDFTTHPAFDYLKKVSKKLAFVFPKWEAEVFGNGWSWNDYTEYYMAERSELPIYGNVIEYSLQQRDKKYFLDGDIYYFRYALNPYVDPIT